MNFRHITEEGAKTHKNIAKLSLTKLRKLEDRKESKNQIFYPRQN